MPTQPLTITIDADGHPLQRRTAHPSQRKEMKTKVKCLGSGLVHFVAVCAECDWEYQDYHTPVTGHKEAKAHVKATGHRVTVEEGFATIYDKETTDHS